ncbi:hypothetical protein U1Q18_047783 [Sarracenia purpurea var. burkii]
MKAPRPKPRPHTEHWAQPCWAVSSWEPTPTPTRPPDASTETNVTAKSATAGAKRSNRAAIGGNNNDKEEKGSRRRPGKRRRQNGAAETRASASPATKSSLPPSTSNERRRLRLATERVMRNRWLATAPAFEDSHHRRREAKMGSTVQSLT